ncbi:MAG TPA: zinc ribbon domain-containing protein [Candidatus Ozemobacteraceae bacterium]|nr:zinc ribbon domain-containing protein [Candidatus Ozemobacteraceae bacterium]
MPIYEFYCSDCNKAFDVLCSMKTDLSTIACDTCHGKNVSKKVSSFATSGGTKTLDLGSGGGGGGHSCGSCSSHSCGSCGH